MKRGQEIYTICRAFKDTSEEFDDGAYILYVNGASRGDSPLGRLMHDFFCTDPNDMYIEVVSCHFMMVLGVLNAESLFLFIG